MRRREFFTLLGTAAAVALPFGVHAQEALPTIGYFSGRSADAEDKYRAAFQKGLDAAGYAESRNVRIEYRYSKGQDDRLPAIAAELVRKQVSLLVATDGPSALAAKHATAIIPIVFSAGGDPIRLGLVESLNRPHSNATGVFVFVSELGPKRLQLLREIVPNPKLIAYVVNLRSGSGPGQLRSLQAAVQAMGQKILVLTAATESEINEAFATIVQRQADAIVYSANPFFQVMRDKLVDLAAQHDIPAIYEWPEFVTAGGLVSYSSSRAEAGRQMGSYAGQILKGAKPGDLPVIQSSKFELAINMKTAKTLGLAIPSGVLAIADEVIE